MHISRRAALALFPLTAAGFLAGCGVISSTTTNGVTTVTVSVAKAEAYISGVAALASTFLAVPGVPLALTPPIVALVNGVLADINRVIPALNAAAGGSATFTFNATSLPAFITTLEADVAQVVKYAGAAVGAMGASVPADVTTYYNAIVSVANALSALWTVGTVAAAVPSRMPVADALALVHIEAPKS